MRARLAWLIGHAFGVRLSDTQRRQLLDLGCAIEFIHLATLIHDDVVDQSLLRRGKQSAHLRWGVSEAVLVGDFVYSRAFELLVEMGDQRVLALTARATNQLAEGEVEQLLDASRADRDEQNYYRVIEKKTGALFGCACAAASSIGGADQQICEDIYNLGIGVGVAFQIIDDLIDYKGQADGMGKNPGDDYREGKYTLPLILLLQQPDQGVRARKLIAEPDDAHLAELTGLMREHGIFDACTAAARNRLAPTIKLLHSLPENEAKSLLLEEMDGFLQRTG